MVVVVVAIVLWPTSLVFVLWCGRGWRWQYYRHDGKKGSTAVGRESRGDPCHVTTKLEGLHFGRGLESGPHLTAKISKAFRVPFLDLTTWASTISTTALYVKHAAPRWEGPHAVMHSHDPPRVELTKASLYMAQSHQGHLLSFRWTSQTCFLLGKHATFPPPPGHLFAMETVQRVPFPFFYPRHCLLGGQSFVL